MATLPSFGPPRDLTRSQACYAFTTPQCVEREEIGGVAHLNELRDQLASLKREDLARFTEGELSGHELLQGFLVK